MAEPIQDGIFREIDEELRQEQFAKLWKRYGRIFVAVAVIIVASVAGFQGWKAYDLSSRGKQGERFAASLRLAGDGNAEAALDALKLFNQEAGSGYKMLSAFQAAALMANGGDAAGAEAAYDTLAADGSLDKLYRDLALLLGSVQRINGGGDTAAVASKLETLTAEDNPWRHSARELLAVLAEQSGDRAKARKLFKALSEDATTPTGIRQRADEMASVLAE